MFKTPEEHLLHQVISGDENISVKDFKYVFYLHAHEEPYCEAFFTHPLMANIYLLSNHHIKRRRDLEKMAILVSKISVSIEFLEKINEKNSDPAWVISLITVNHKNLTSDVFKFLISFYKTEGYMKYELLNLVSQIAERRNPEELEILWYSMRNSAYNYRMTILLKSDFAKDEIPLNILIETFLFHQEDERYEDYFKKLYTDSNTSYKEDLIRYAEQFIDEKFPVDIPLEWLIELVTPFAEENIRKREESLKEYSYLRDVC